MQLLSAIVRLLGVVALVVAAILALTQVQVSDRATSATRVCGSTLDVMTDRVDWQDWWARDLDEPDAEIREALVRTRRCPGALNSRTVWVGAVAAIGLAAVAGSIVTRQVRVERGRLHRLGTVTLVTGSALTVAGIAAIIVLTADAQSTLFLYVDRLVVALIGLIVLVPALAVCVLGQALRVLGSETASEPADTDA